jgi:hypothetical protein
VQFETTNELLMILSFGSETAFACQASHSLSCCLNNLMTASPGANPGLFSCFHGTAEPITCANLMAAKPCNPQVRLPHGNPTAAMRKAVHRHQQFASLEPLGGSSE